MLRAVLERCIEPSDELLDRDDRRHARLIAAVLLAVVPIGLITSALRLHVQPGFLPTFLSNLVVLLTLGGLGVLARTRHYRFAAGGASAMVVLAGALSGWRDASDSAWWAYEILGVLLATALIGLPGATLVAIFALACVFVEGMTDEVT